MGIYMWNEYIPAEYPTEYPAEYGNWSEDMVDSFQSLYRDQYDGDLNSTIFDMFGEELTMDLDNRISGERNEYEYTDIIYNGEQYYGLQIADGGDMLDIKISSYVFLGQAVDAICIVSDYNDPGNVVYVDGENNGNGDWIFYMGDFAGQFEGCNAMLLFIFKSGE